MPLRRIFALLVIMLAGCGGGSTSTDSAGSSSETPAQTSQHTSESLARADAEVLLEGLGFRDKESKAAGLTTALTTADDLCVSSMFLTSSCPESGSFLWKASCLPGQVPEMYRLTFTMDFSDCGRDGVVYNGPFAAEGEVVATKEGALDVSIHGRGDGLTAASGGVIVIIDELTTVLRALRNTATGAWDLSFVSLVASTEASGQHCDVGLDEAVCSGSSSDSSDDADGDGISDRFDNCPTVSNRSQLDADGDGLGSLCDRDEAPAVSSELEDCQNGVDDNGDGFVDCDDALCDGKTVCVQTPEPPTVAVCGDSFHSSELGELCDFSASPDGCASGFCSLSCTSCIGDGMIGGYEQCDDGNTADNDGCSSAGAVESGYTCNLAEPSACAPIGPEVCGNDIDDDQDEIFDCKDPDCAKDPLCQEDCTNQKDDDFDGLIDCMDLDCGCKETDCHDFKDNDGDQLIDCKSDPDCWVEGAGCTETCEFGHDEDADGLVDCDDPDCFDDPLCNLCGNGKFDSGEQCDPGFADDVCVTRQIGGACDSKTCQCCGDGTCAEGETVDTCAVDCAVPVGSCGDGVCSEGESPVACPQECGKTPGCGDGICDGANKESPETVENCPADCGKIVCQSGNEIVATVCDGKPECDASGPVPAGYDELICGTKEAPCPAGSLYCDVDQKCHVPCDGVQGCDSSDLGFNDESPLWCGEICDDSQDNDLDGKTDCDDVDCVYDAACFKEMNCTDKVDDDKDQLIDCADPDCVADPACIEILCDDTVDNDGDGKTDCDDSDCVNDAACAAPSEAGLCKNGIDDDNDKATDCADSDCWVKGGNCAEVCTGKNDEDGDGAVDCDDTDCAADKACAITSEAGLCKNGVDDDNDQATDCADSDCWVSGGVCTEVCTGGFDEDGDGAVDCADSDCSLDKNCPPPPPPK